MRVFGPSFFINKIIKELKRKEMSKLTATEVRGIMEAYNAVYAPQESLEQEIFETVAYALISQGHTAIDVLEYFANVDDEVIVEDIFAIAEGTLLIESVVSEEYIEEQIQQLDEILGAALRIGQAAVKGAQFAQKTGMLARAGGALRAAGTAATRVAQQGTKASAVVRPAIGRALQGAKSTIGGAVSKVKDVARGALNKLPGGAGGKLAGALKGGAKLALGGAAFEAGMRGAGALLGGGKAPAAKTAPTADKAKFNASAALGGKTAFAAGGGAAAMKKDPKLTAADIQKAGSQALFKAGGGSAAMTQKGQTRAQVMAQGSKNVAPKPAAPEVKATNTIAAKPSQPPVAPAKPKTPSTPAGKPATGMLGKTSYEVRTPNRAEFKASQEYRQQNPNAKPEDVLKAAQAAGKAQKSVDADIAKFNKPEELNKPAPAGTALRAQQDEQERKRKAAEQGKATAAQTKPQPVNASYEYDAYDLVLEYLFSEGHVDTVDEAHYVMLEMDSNTIQDIVEAKYGTAAGRKALAKKIRKGENIGKKGPGTGFKAVAKAAEKGGAEDPEAVAAAAMYKTYGGKKGKSHKEY